MQLSYQTIVNELHTRLYMVLCQPISQPYLSLKSIPTIVDLLYPVQMKSERLISAKTTLVNAFEERYIPFYQNTK